MPSLALPELKRRIARKQLEPIHLLVGPDVRLVGRIVDDIEATVDPADQPFAVERIYAGEAGGAPLDIAAAASVFPMLGDRRLVFVLRAERLLKPKRASRAAEAEDETGAGGGEEGDTALDLRPLEDYIASPAPTTTLVLVATEIDRGRRLTKQLLAAATVTEFGGIEAARPAERQQARGATLEWVRAELGREGRAIDAAAVGVLVDRAGGDINKLRGDVERLLIYAQGQEAISKEDVLEVASIATELDDWAVVNAISDGDAPKALREAGARFERGDSPHAMVGQLRWWVSQKLAASAPGRVRAALDALLRTDLALKSSGGDERVLVERLVADLTGERVARQDTRSGRRR